MAKRGGSHPDNNGGTEGGKKGAQFKFPDVDGAKGKRESNMVVDGWKYQHER